MMELISITRIDVMNSKIPNFKIVVFESHKGFSPTFQFLLGSKNSGHRQTRSTSAFIDKIINSKQSLDEMNFLFPTRSVPTTINISIGSGWDSDWE